MKRTITLAAGLAVMASGVTAADECSDRVAAQVMKAPIDEPLKGHLVVQNKGMPQTENEFYMLSSDHMMFRSIDPANQPLILTYMGAMYQSSDDIRNARSGHDQPRAL